MREAAAIHSLTSVRQHCRRLRCGRIPPALNAEQLQAQKEAAGSGLAALQKEEEDLLHQTKEIAELKKQNQTELKDSEAMEKAHTFAVETYQKRLDEDREQETTAARELEEIHLNTASIRQKAEFTASNLNRVDSELRRLREEERQLTENREQAEEDTRSREAGIEL